MEEVPDNVVSYAETWLDPCMTYVDGVLTQLVDGETITYAQDGSISAVSEIVNEAPLPPILDDVGPEPWPYAGSCSNGIKQTCTGELYMGGQGFFGGVHSSTGSLVGPGGPVGTDLCIPIKCKEVCDGDLKLVYRLCVNIFGTWTHDKYSGNAHSSAEVRNQISVRNPDGSNNCFAAGVEKLHFLEATSSLEVFRFSNTYYLNGCVDCDGDFRINVDSTQTTPADTPTEQDDAAYKLDMEYMFLRECE